MIKKGEAVKIFGLAVMTLFIVVLLISLASSESGFLKSLRSILTGKATSQTFNLNISVGNSAPNITAVYIGSSQSPSEGGVRNIQFYFTANDTDGSANIDTASGKANFTFYNASSTIVRTNNS